MLMLSWPFALFGSKLWIILAISSWEKLTEDKRLSSNNEVAMGVCCCYAKNPLKSSAFSLKSVKNFSSWNNDGIRGIFLLFKKWLNRHQHALELLWT